MNTKNLTPRKIELGWAKRWSLQVWDLWTRSLGVTLATIAVIMAANLCMPHFFLVSLLIVIPGTAFLFTLLRALDLGQGMNTLREAWSLLRGCLRYIWRFTLQVWLWMIAVEMLDMVLAHPSAHHGASAVFTHSMTGIPWVLQEAFLHSVDWLDLLAMPLSGPIRYLTLAAGHNLSYHMNNTYKGLFLNWRIAVLGLLLGFLACPPLGDGISWLALQASPWLAIWAGNAIAALLILIVVTYAYLFSRELFEGTTTNAPRVPRLDRGPLRMADPVHPSSTVRRKKWSIS